MFVPRRRQCRFRPDPLYATPTERGFPSQWAAAHHNLGTAYSQLTADRGGNLRGAIACYKLALRVFTRNAFPKDHAASQNDLGIAYLGLETGERGQNVRCAIDCFQAALLVSTESEFPEGCAIAQHNLGDAYAKLPTGDRAENLGRGIDYLETAANGFDALGLDEDAVASRPCDLSKVCDERSGNSCSGL